MVEEPQSGFKCLFARACPSELEFGEYLRDREPRDRAFPIFTTKRNLLPHDAYRVGDIPQFPRGIVFVDLEDQFIEKVIGAGIEDNPSLFF